MRKNEIGEWFCDDLDEYTGKEVTENRFSK